MTLARWLRLMNALELPANYYTYQLLWAAYTQPYRYYHNQQHITDVLSQFDLFAMQATNPLAVELALWFHDAVYNPTSMSNEADSAAWLVHFLQANKVSAECIATVERLVMATAHTHPAASSDEALIVDIDLSILGASADKYAQFEHAVRQEYSHVAQAQFSAKRKAILGQFLHAKNLYSHPAVATRYAAQARCNLQAAIAQL